MWQLCSDVSDVIQPKSTSVLRINGRGLNQEVIKCDFQNANICTADVGSVCKDKKSALCRHFDGKLDCKNDVHNEVTHLLFQTESRVARTTPDPKEPSLGQFLAC